VTRLRRTFAVLALSVIALGVAAQPAGAVTVTQANTYISVKQQSGTVGPVVLDVKLASKDDRAVVQLWTNGNGSHQRWQITRLLNFNSDVAWYQFKNINSGKCLDASMDTAAHNGTPVYQYTCSDSPNQVWQWERRQPGDNWGFLVNLWGNLCLDGTGGSTGNGTPLQLWACNEDDSSNYHQRFNPF